MKLISKEVFLKAIKLGKGNLVTKTKRKHYGVDNLEYQLRKPKY